MKNEYKISRIFDKIFKECNSKNPNFDLKSQTEKIQEKCESILDNNLIIDAIKINKSSTNPNYYESIDINIRVKKSQHFTGISKFYREIDLSKYEMSITQLQDGYDNILSCNFVNPNPEPVMVCSRSGLKPATKIKVMERDNYTCQVCGKTRQELLAEGSRLEVDHIRPISRGGTNDLYNLQTLCHECNEGKSNELLPNLLKDNKDEVVGGLSSVDLELGKRVRVLEDELNELKVENKSFKMFLEFIRPGMMGSSPMSYDAWVHYPYSVNDENGMVKE